MKTLFEFDDADPIAVREKDPLIINGRAIAWVGPSNRDGPVAVMRRHRHEYDGGRQDYFRKVGGYTIGAATLEAMKLMDVERIAIEEVDNDRVLEFQLQQYLTSDYRSSTVSGLEDRGRDGENICIPASKAIYKWTREEAAIVAAGGGV